LSLRHATVCLLLFAFVEAPARAQAPAADETITMTTRVAAVTTVVRDDKGHLLSGLKKEDFYIEQDGKPETIRYFNQDSDLPLRLGLLLDTSGSQWPYFNAERTACLTFLHSMLTRPEDKAYLIQFDDNILLLQKETSDISLLEQAIGRLRDPHLPRKKNPGGTLLFDAISGAANLVSSKQDGRRAIIVLTDGEDEGSTFAYNQAISLAQLADTTVYSILYGADLGDVVMKWISESTGGRSFMVSKKLPVEAIFKEIEAELRTQYRLGFNPPPSEPQSFHVIRVKTKMKHTIIQARKGYFTPE
jgi:VWFA-related protein